MKTTAKFFRFVRLPRSGFAPTGSQFRADDDQRGAALRKANPPQPLRWARRVSDDDGFVRRFKAQSEIQLAMIARRWMNNEVRDFLDQLAFAEIPAFLDRQLCRWAVRLPGHPASQFLEKHPSPPEVVGFAVACHRFPSPKNPTVMRMTLVRVVGHAGALSRTSRVQATVNDQRLNPGAPRGIQGASVAGVRFAD